MKIIFISDTHTKHEGLKIEPCDILIHSGDFSNRGSIIDFTKFINWFDKQPAKHKIFIAGNHDFCFENDNKNFCLDKLKNYKNIHYLQDSSIIIDGINIYGSPWTPYFYNWAFNGRTKDYQATNKNPWLREICDKIPNNTDILITHGPPRGILDLLDSFGSNPGENVGCEYLLNKVNEVKPKYHVFGHIHEGYGIREQDGITFINASVLNSRYELVNKPIIYNIFKNN